MKFQAATLLAALAITTSAQTTDPNNPIVSALSEYQAEVKSAEIALHTTIPVVESYLSSLIAAIPSVTASIGNNPSSAAIYSTFVSQYASLQSLFNQAPSSLADQLSSSAAASGAKPAASSASVSTARASSGKNVQVGAVGAVGAVALGVVAFL